MNFADQVTDHFSASTPTLKLEAAARVQQAVMLSLISTHPNPKALFEAFVNHMSAPLHDGNMELLPHIRETQQLILRAMLKAVDAKS